jgi:hypothetical protein
VATAAEIAVACRMLANEIRSVHLPQLDAARVDIGAQLDRLAAEGNDVFQLTIQSMLIDFHSLVPDFSFLALSLDHHAGALEGMASRLDEVAGAGLVGGAALAAGGMGLAGHGVSSLIHGASLAKTAAGALAGIESLAGTELSGLPSLLKGPAGFLQSLVTKGFIGDVVDSSAFGKVADVADAISKGPVGDVIGGAGVALDAVGFVGAMQHRQDRLAVGDALGVASGGLFMAGTVLDGTVFGAPVGVVLQVASGATAVAGLVVSNWDPISHDVGAAASAVMSEASQVARDTSGVLAGSTGDALHAASEAWRSVGVGVDGVVSHLF